MSKEHSEKKDEIYNHINIKKIIYIYSNLNEWKERIFLMKIIMHIKDYKPQFRTELDIYEDMIDHKYQLIWEWLKMKTEKSMQQRIEKN